MPDLKRIASGLLVSLVATGLTLLALEIVFRLFVPQSRFSVHCCIWDRDVGIRQIPNAKGCIRTEEFDTDVVINSGGLRDRETALRKPAGTRRVMCLGDSFTFGYGVEADQTFPKVLEGLLNGESGTGTGWEVINAGVNGTGTAHQYIHYNEEGNKYDPDFVLVCVCGANDFSDNLGSGLFSLDSGDLVRHPASLSGGRKLRYIMQRLPGYGVVFRRSHLVTFIKHKIAACSAQRGRAEPADPARAAANKTAAIALTERLFLALRDSCASHGSTLVVTVVPQSDAGEQPERVLALIEFLRAQGIPYIDLVPRFNQETLQGIVNFYKADGHWTARGHQLVARLLSEYFLQQPGRDAGS